MRFLVRAVVATAALAIGLPAAAQAAVPLKPCADIGEGVRCGSVLVPLDRDGAVPGSVRLKVAVQEPKGEAQRTIFLLAGGPGQAAAPFVPTVEKLLGSAARNDRVVAFDQRGTGDSSFLRCRALDHPGHLSEAEAVGRCAAQLGTKRIAYPTSASVQDLEAVRQALGVDQLTLLGISYGTKLALDYASAYPDHVRDLVLDSAVDPIHPDPFNLDGFAALPRVLTAFCADRACPFTRDLPADVSRLVTQLNAQPLAGTYYDGRGRPHRTSITAGELYELLSATDSDPALATVIPGAVVSALRGDSGPLATLVGGGGGGGSEGGGDVSTAVLIATDCEDLQTPWTPGTPVDQRPAAIQAAIDAIPIEAFWAFGPKVGRVTSMPEICREWPDSPIAQPVTNPTDKPTLILSGAEDLRTPTEAAQALAASLPASQFVQIPVVGHSTLTTDPSGCAVKAMRAFLAGRPVAQCQGGKRLLHVRPPAPRRLADVPVAAYLHGDAGRVASAAALTVDDLVVSSADVPLVRRGVSVGGLRGGFATFKPPVAIVLHHYAFVPGVQVDGPLLAGMTVTGPHGIRGTLRLSRGGLVGTVGGHRVRLPLSGISADFGPSASGTPASAMLARWPTPIVSTTSSSSAPPASPAA